MATRRGINISIGKKKPRVTVTRPMKTRTVASSRSIPKSSLSGGSKRAHFGRPKKSKGPSIGDAQHRRNATRGHSSKLGPVTGPRSSHEGVGKVTSQKTGKRMPPGSNRHGFDSNKFNNPKGYHGLSHYNTLGGKSRKVGIAAAVVGVGAGAGYGVHKYRQHRKAKAMTHAQPGFQSRQPRKGR